MSQVLPFPDLADPFAPAQGDAGEVRDPPPVTGPTG